MHIPQQLSANDYVRKVKMDKLGTWGTDVEIIALATLLSTRITVYHRPPSSETSIWFNYDPLVPSDIIHDISIYLNNPTNHFERVMSVKTLR
jgi:hypothetical protein